MEFMKDHAPWVIAGFAFLGSVFLGVLGFGKLVQRVSENEEDIVELKGMDFITFTDCQMSQKACNKLQCLKHTQYKEEVIKLTRLIENVSEKSDTHYEKMIDRLDNNMSKILEVIG